MATLEDYSPVKKIQEIFDDETTLSKFLRPIPRRHLEHILIRNGFAITKARSKLQTFLSTCKSKSRIGPELARQLLDAREAGAFRHFKSRGKIATIEGAPFKVDEKRVLELKLNKLLDKGDWFKSLDRNFLFTIPKMENKQLSIVLAYSNEPRPFEEWIYDVTIMETVSRARYVLDLETGRISAGGQNRSIVEEGLGIISTSLAGKPKSFEYARFDPDQIMAIVKRTEEPIREYVIETKESLGFIDQIIIKGTDIAKGLEMLKEQGIDLEGVGKVSSAETTTLRITSQGEYRDRKGDQRALTDFP